MPSPLTEAPKAVVLLSGGLDSYTTAAIASHEGFVVHALTVRYGQIHAQELVAARRVCESLGITARLEVSVDLAALGGSALTGDRPVPKDGAHGQEIPPTYVPARKYGAVVVGAGLGGGAWRRGHLRGCERG